MADENTVQPQEYTTVQLRKDLHKSVRFLALRRDTDVKTEIEKAVTRYLEQTSTQQTEAVAQ